MPQEEQYAAQTESFLRRALFVAGVSVFALTVVELVLQEHTGGGVQTLPFVACALGLIAAAMLALSRARPVVLGARALLGLVILASVFGLWEHLEHNYDFTREIMPGLSSGEAMMDAIFGASPLLAPGILALGAFLVGASSALRYAPETP